MDYIVYGDTLKDTPITLEFLMKNVHGNDNGLNVPKSDFCQYIKYLMDLSDSSEDDDIFDSFNKKLMTDLNNDINQLIENKQIVLVDIPDYVKLLNKIDMANDCPEEGIYIEGKPNINGFIISLMLNCCISGTSGLSENQTSDILDMFQKTTISELYECYTRVFAPLINKLAGEQEAVKDAISGLGNTLEKGAQMISNMDKQRKAIIFLKQFIDNFIRKYDKENGNLGYNTVCPISLESFVDGENVFTMPCGHNFSLKYTQQLMCNLGKCPICRDDPLHNKRFWEIMDIIKESINEYEVSPDGQRIDNLIKMITDTSIKFKNSV
tara:strand:+ start:430 stop:1401 length:972 start_codon:yes stop_codon:yes gene_type:complete